MAVVWVIGKYVKIHGMNKDFKILSYAFIFGEYVEMILESTEGSRYFIKRRKSEVSSIDDEYAFSSR